MTPHPLDLPIQRILVDLETRLPPWMKLIPPSDESAFTRLSKEIVALADLVNPTSKERLIRKDIIDRLQLQVRKLWPSATVIPIGSYAQELYTSSSDMDLFVSLPDAAPSLDHLEILYNSVSSLAVPGTLNIVRGARVPIVKYIDVGGSGIQIDVSVNNVSATSSTAFVQHHLSKSHILRPLTMILKQWLFQRKMNEVYSRGGLSSYALFLLVLTIVHQHHFVDSEEAIGRYLLQFLRQWTSPTAFENMIRPLHGYIRKPGMDYSLCIEDPVNEQNWIGRQTFSIREIQQEWKLSLNALMAAIDEYNEGSLLASIVGLTTREYECRKQINSLPIPTLICPPPNLNPIPKLVSPPLELNPIPAKRTKFRNMLTRDGRLIGNEEVSKIIQEKECRPKDTERQISKRIIREGQGSRNTVGEPELKTTEIDPIPIFDELFNFNTSPPKLVVAPRTTTLEELASINFADDTTIQSFSTAAEIDFSLPSSPSIQSVSTSPTISAATNASPTSHIPPQPALTPLLDLEGPPPSTLDDLAGLFASPSLNDLAGLDFHFNVPNDSEEGIVFQGRHSRKATAVKVDPITTDRAFRMFSQGIKPQD